MSEKIVDDYSDDFDQIEESSKLNKKKNKDEDSSGGFEEQYEDDMFWSISLFTLTLANLSQF